MRYMILVVLSGCSRTTEKQDFRGHLSTHHILNVELLNS